MTSPRWATSISSSCVGAASRKSACSGCMIATSMTSARSEALLHPAVTGVERPAMDGGSLRRSGRDRRGQVLRRSARSNDGPAGYHWAPMCSPKTPSSAIDAIECWFTDRRNVVLLFQPHQECFRIDRAGDEPVEGQQVGLALGVRPAQHGWATADSRARDSAPRSRLPGGVRLLPVHGSAEESITTGA